MPSHPRSSALTGLLLILVAGILLRVAFVASVPIPPVSDFARYVEVATNLANGQGLQVAGTPFIGQPPLYPAALGAWFSAFGAHVAAGKALNLLLGSATLLLWAFASSRSGMRRSWQFASLALLAFHPALIAYTGVLGTETLAVFLAVLAFALACLPMWMPVSGILGVVLALIALNRPQLLPLPIGVVFCLLLGRFDLPRVRSCLVMLLAFGAVLLPWTLRNEALFDHAIPVSANSGYTLLVNNNADNQTGGWMPLSRVPLSAQDLKRFQQEADLAPAFLAGGDEDAKFLQWTPAADGVARSIALDWMSEHPQSVLRLAAMRIKASMDPATLLYWPFIDVEGAPAWLGWVVGLLDVLLVLLAAMGAVRAWLQLRQLSLATLLALGMLGLGWLSIAVFEGQGRYLIPMLPAMLWLLAAPYRDYRNVCRTATGHPSVDTGKVSSTS